MDIDDLLLECVPDFDNFLTNEMKRVAGDEIYVRMIEFFGSNLSARKWFYSHMGFNEHMPRPYDMCVAGKQDEVEAVLNRLEYGVFS